ncbi:MAG: O-antigen ligase family protein [Lachnospiraceae bacterium]|nr:O-antigen ligase family protein [Lachnospiraceae bacterium]
MLPIELIFSFILCSTYVYKTGESVKERNYLYVHIAFMVYRIVVSSIILLDFYNSSKKIFVYELGAILLSNCLIRSVELDELIKTIKLFGIINAILGVVEFITKNSLFYSLIDVSSRQFGAFSFGTIDSRVRTVFIHPIVCAVFCVITWIILVYYPCNNKIIDTIAKGTVIICLVGTQSRSSWVSFVIVNIIIFTKRIADREIVIDRKQLLINMIIVIGSLCICVVFKSQLMNIWNLIKARWLTGMDKSNMSNFNRVTMIRNGLRAYSEWGVGEKMFGKGFEYAISFLKSHSIRGWSGAVDNTYLTVLLDYGLCGLLFMMYYLIIAFRSILSKHRIYEACGICLLSIMISGFFYDIFAWFTSDILMAVLICILSSGIYFDEALCLHGE